jgi:hypothetical protein
MPRSTPFVPLDADYFDNPKVIAVGEKGEILYVRGLAKAKMLLTDGVLLDAHLDRLGLSGVQARAKKLVGAGLWERTEGGYRIVGWLERNLPADAVVADMEAKRDAGILGNHTRWHKERVDPKCPHCAIAPAMCDATTVRVPKTETETENLKNPLTPTSGGTDSSTAQKRSPRAAGTSPRQIAAREAEEAKPEAERTAALTFGLSRRQQGIHETEQDAVDDFLSRYPDRPDLREAALQGWLQSGEVA